MIQADRKHAAKAFADAKCSPVMYEDWFNSFVIFSQFKRCNDNLLSLQLTLCSAVLAAC